MGRHVVIRMCVWLLAVILGAGVARVAFPADGSNLQASPESIGGVILGQQVRLMTGGGTYLEGKVARAAETEITIRVKSSEPKGHIQGSEAVIPTSDISVVYLRKNGTVALPIVTGVVGAFAALWAAAYAADDVHSTAGYISIGLASAAGGAAGGALLGREAARKTVTINVTRRP